MIEYLSLFEHHVTALRVHGHQGYGRCPFHDDRKASFSVDLETGLWTCHGACSTSGNADQFAQRLGIDQPQNRPAVDGTVATYDYRDENGTPLFQVVRFAPKDFRVRRPDGSGWTWNLDGVRRVPYRLPEVLAAVARGEGVWIVEGEKDADRLATLGLCSTTNPGGAGKWRDEFAQYFKGARVAILPDNDDPGRRHAEEIARSLHNAASEIKILTLPGLPSKGDVTDWLRSGHTIAELQQIADHAKPWNLSAQLKTPGSTWSVQEVVAAVREWLLLERPGEIARVLLAVIVANRLQSNPLWMFLITPPGGGKTELLKALREIPEVYLLSSLTPQTFISGKADEGKELSLLPRLSGKVLVLKDFTTVLTMHRDSRQEILAQLREIYDGLYSKRFGTGKEVRWEGKVGFIAGVTPVIDTHHTLYQVLGERFIQYRLPMSDGIKAAKAAMRQRGREQAMEQALRDAFAGFFTGRVMPRVEDIAFPDDPQNEIAELAAFVVRARSGIIRDSFSTREIEYVPEPETPTRLAKQLALLATALAVVEDEAAVTDAVMPTVVRVGLDCIPQDRRVVLDALAGATDWQQTSKVAEATGYPTGTVRRILQDLAALRVVTVDKPGPGKADQWRLTDAVETVFRAALTRLSGTVPETSEHDNTGTITSPYPPHDDISGKVLDRQC